MDFLADDSDTEANFKINEDYAKRYDKWRRGEVVQQLKDKYGETADLDSSSDDEEEDENAAELTEDIEKQFFKTLSCLKEKNPIIYDDKVHFFDQNKDDKANGSNTNKKVKKKAEPTLTVAEYQRRLILEKGGQISDDDEKPILEMSNVEQEKAIKESFKDVLKDSESEDEAEWGGIFQKRTKTTEELRQEEDDYREWLAGEREKLKNPDEEKELKGLHDYWSNPKLDEDELFLKDYILNRRFLDKDNDSHIPSYEEIVHDSASDLSADESTIQKQEEFEKKYNFRFEEPDQEFIKTYPRTVEQSMRKKDDRRVKHREEVKKRKEAEKVKKAEDLKQLKKLKKKEIMEKIKKLQEITGNEDMGFDNNDLEEDFDPEAHDKRMSQLFNKDYYGAGGEEERPDCPELEEELEIENWDKWDGNVNDEGQTGDLHCEDPGFNMDCDYDSKGRLTHQKELMETSKGRRNKRRKSKFAEAIARKKPVFDPKDKSFEKYLDEYYALDYEDLIGDIPCRFKYRKVVPNDYGLSVEEILAAPDRELNSWASVKRIMQRRPDQMEAFDVKAYQNKARNIQKKIKCLPSIYGPANSNEEPPEMDPPRKTRGKQKQYNEETQRPEEANNEEPLKKKKKKNAEEIAALTAEEEEKASSIKGKKKGKKMDCVAEDEPEEKPYVSVINSSTDESSKSKKKNKNGNKNEENLEKNINDSEKHLNLKKKKKNKTSAGNKSELELNASNDNKLVPNEFNRKVKGNNKSNANGDFNKKSNKFQQKKNENTSRNFDMKNKKFKNKFRRDSRNDNRNGGCNLSDERLKSYGFNPKKFKNKLKYSNADQFGKS